MAISRRTVLAGTAVLAAFAGESLAEGVAKQEMPKDGVILVAMVKAKPGQEEAVQEALMALVEPTRKEPGCLCYNLHQSKSDKTQFMFYEQWASKEALIRARQDASHEGPRGEVEGPHGQGRGYVVRVAEVGSGQQAGWHAFTTRSVG